MAEEEEKEPHPQPKPEEVQRWEDEGGAVHPPPQEDGEEKSSPNDQ